jgi:hypothetical protein
MRNEPRQPLATDARLLADGQEGRAALRRLSAGVHRDRDAPVLARPEESMLDCLPRYPLRTQYDDECIADYEIWDCEQRLVQLAREANGCEWRAWELDGDGNTDIAEAYIDLADALWERYGEVKNRLIELETGGW